MPLTIKKQLLHIQQNQYQLPAGISAYELALEMMKNIGSPDPELRDSLIYTTLSHWINAIGTVGPVGDTQKDETLLANTKNFLRSLYFRLLEQKNVSSYTEAILNRLNERNTYLISILGL